MNCKYMHILNNYYSVINMIMEIDFVSGSLCIGTAELQHPLFSLSIIDNIQYNESLFLNSLFILVPLVHEKITKIRITVPMMWCWVLCTCARLR